MTYKRSNEVAWKFSNECFQSMFGSWDVDEAKRVVSGKPRPVHTLDITGISSLARFMGGCSPDPSTVDIEFPLIAVRTKIGGKMTVMVIDGWNRIRKAIAQGVTELPAVVLTAKESKSIECKS